MNKLTNDWLAASGWTGIAARVFCEILFLVVILNLEHIAAWAEQYFNHRALVVDGSRIALLQKAIVAMVALGLVIEFVNALKILLGARRR